MAQENNREKAVEAPRLSWFVVMTRPAREALAAFEIANQGFETWYPQYRRARVHNHRVERITTPLFPRYIFVKFDRERDAWGCIRNTKGVFCILSDAQNRPQVCPQEAFAAMKDFDEAEATNSREFRAGQRVRVTSGTAQGFEGLFVANSSQRTMAFLEIMGRKVKVDLEAIEPIS